MGTRASPTVLTLGAVDHHIALAVMIRLPVSADTEWVIRLIHL